MKFSIIICLLLGMLFSLEAADPVVSNVRASQRDGTKLVDIWYDVVDTDGDKLDISIAVNGGSPTIGASSFSGDIGNGLRPGSGKHIVWNAGADWNGNYSSGVSFNITADDVTVPSGMVLIPGGTNSGTNPLADGESYSDFYPSSYSLTVDSFYMDRTEVTKAQWDTVYNWAVNHGYSFYDSGSGKAINHPVHFVNWYDCVK
jgi:formylglycine-generating enzyme required for sulfatase activity